ncbi:MULTISPECIES: phage adaptor protein [unclassified Brenneria]|uniref:phage adaptor protein n=1 Tax=unclassified Brenneria TaxID=2634434 RepID=UPI001552C3DD|nr:DUF6682 family protein [Brenneria sp. hezel4-2-4]MEE3649456.1 DUF6682 family protein [Brenneria sp. HEZEL_4_2_4]NPC99412.1 hypothetical protein [Brenneria sp. hezel4-2-4]
MTTINDVIGRANAQLIDPQWLRWTKSELLDYFNDAINAVIIIRPDAGLSEETFTCAAGTRQELPEGAIRLLDVVRVAGGKAVLPFPRESLDYQFPDWHSMIGPVERYCYDWKTPRTFFVFPGAEEGTQLEINVSRLPSTATISDLNSATNQAFPLDDLYINPVLEWILFRAFGKDAENGANAQLSSQHYQTFVDLLGVKSQTDNAPGAGAPPPQQQGGSAQ